MQVETETTYPNAYRIRVGLKSNDGKHIGESVQAQLNVGIEKTTLYFESELLMEREIEGVLTIDHVDLDYRDYLLLDRRQNVGQTRDYRLKQLQKKIKRLRQ